MEFPPRGSLAWAILHDQRRYRRLRRGLLLAVTVVFAAFIYSTLGGGWGAIGFWLVTTAVILLWPMGSDPP